MSKVSDALRSRIRSGELKLDGRQDGAVLQGYRDGNGGKSRRSNPYQKTDLARFWRLGWDNAFNDRAGNPRAHWWKKPILKGG